MWLLLLFLIAINFLFDFNLITLFFLAIVGFTRVLLNLVKLFQIKILNLICSRIVVKSICSILFCLIYQLCVSWIRCFG